MGTKPKALVSSTPSPNHEEPWTDTRKGKHCVKPPCCTSLPQHPRLTNKFSILDEEHFPSLTHHHTPHSMESLSSPYWHVSLTTHLSLQLSSNTQLSWKIFTHYSLLQVLGLHSLLCDCPHFFSHIASNPSHKYSPAPHRWRNVYRGSAV